ncbi:MAG: TolC family protein [Ignavibacteria bacterium]|jgi:outer membrane protein TolC
MKKINYIILAFLICLCSHLSAQQVLTLEESKQLTLQNNTEIKNSKLEVESANQIKKSVFTSFFPNISAGGMIFEAQDPLMELESEEKNLPVYDGNPANLGTATQYAYMRGNTVGMMKKGTVGFINAIQPVFTGGRIWNGNKFASVGKQAAELKNKLTKDDLLIKTEEQYWQIVSLEEKFKTVEKYEEMLNSLLKQVGDAYNSGLVMKNDFLKVKVRLSEVLLNKSKLANGINLAKMAFCQHLGIPYDSSLALENELEIDELPQTLYVDHEGALVKRTEYNLLELSVKSEEIQTKMKLGEFLPQVAVGVSGMYMKFDDGDDKTLGMAFGTVSVPISDWWSGAHELEERSIKEEIAKNNFKNNSELLLLQMERSWQKLTEAYKQYSLSVESLEQAEENMKVNQDSYDNGLITTSDLLEAQAILQEAEDRLTDAKTNYILMKTKYLQVTGR